MKRSFLLILLLFCVMLTGCQAVKDNTGSYYAVVTNAPTVTQIATLAAAETEAPTQMPTEVPVQRSGIAEQINAPAHVTETFASNTGKVVITLDADVTVPDADMIRVYQCRPRLFTESELLAMADACFGERAYTGERRLNHMHRGIDKNNTFEHEEYTMYLDSVAQVRNPGSSLDWPAYSFIAHMNALPDGSIDWAQALFDYSVVKGDVDYAPQLVTQLNTRAESAFGCSLTREQARQMADQTVAAFAPGFSCVVQGPATGEIAGSEVRDGSIAMSEEEAWHLFYTRELELPVTYDPLQPNDPYYNMPPHESIEVVINDNGVQMVYYNAPLEITGVLQENCTLLPFEQMMEIARSVMPLKYAYQESRQGEWQCTVTEIRLGYMRVRSKNSPDVYEFIPVWDFFEAQDLNSLLTINAIDGTVIDRAYGY